MDLCSLSLSQGAWKTMVGREGSPMFHDWDFKEGVLSQIHTPQERAGSAGGSPSLVVAPAPLLLPFSPQCLSSFLLSEPQPAIPVCFPVAGSPTEGFLGAKWD